MAKSLTEDEAGVVKGMLARGDKQHDIAAYFGVNGGRIAEVSTGKKWPDILAVGHGELPEPGPYRLRDMADLSIALQRYADTHGLVHLKATLRSFLAELDMENGQ